MPARLSSDYEFTESLILQMVDFPIRATSGCYADFVSPYQFLDVSRGIIPPDSGKFAISTTYGTYICRRMAISTSTTGRVRISRRGTFAMGFCNP